MNNIKQAFKTLVAEKPSQLILGIVFIIYLLLNIQTPALLAGPIDSIFGKVLIALIAIVIFIKTNPVIGVLGFIVAYQIIKTASITSGTFGLKHFAGSELNKLSEMKLFNDGSVAGLGLMEASAGSLEEEMVDTMAPLVIHPSNPNMNYQPILDEQHEAAAL
jgi:hypothetical protein